jgi:hypothetical protein
MHGNRKAKLTRGFSQTLHLVLEPRHLRRIVTEAHVSTRVHRLDSVAAERMFRANQLTNLARRIRDFREPEMASTWKGALHVAVPPGCTDHVCSNDQAWTVDEAVVDRIAQVDGRPVWIQRSHIAQGREAVAHILLRKMQSRQRFGCGALQDVLPEMQPVETEMHMRIDTSGHDRPIAQINNHRRGWTTDCWRDIGNDTILDQDFGRPGERIV